MHVTGGFDSSRRAADARSDREYDHVSVIAAHASSTRTKASI
jgi:hypothetical protein